MQLNSKQIHDYQERGFVFLPSVFSPPELASLRRELPELMARPGLEAVREPASTDGGGGGGGGGGGDSDSSPPVRLVYGCHTFSETFRRLSLHPRLLEPVQQLLREPCYIHQTRLNPKQGFSGGSWDWHQDFGTWNLVDGMAAPHAVMAAVFLDEASAVNAPLM